MNSQSFFHVAAVSLFLAGFLILAACTDTPAVSSSNSGGGGEGNCSDGEVYNAISGECVPDDNSGGNQANQDTGTNQDDATEHPWEGRDDLDPWEDESGDGIPNQFDNCPFHYNPDQADRDGDGVGDVCDNCPDTANAGQEARASNPLDDRGIRMGNACAPGVEYVDDVTDSDGDGVPDVIDNCPNDYNPNQEDSDDDGVGDACDNCPHAYNPTQTSTPGNPTDDRGIRMGDACAPTPNNITICDDQNTQFEVLAPNVYMVIDQSGSMDYNLHNNTTATSGNSRWDHAAQGLDAVADELADDIRFGIGEFAGSCGTNSLTHHLSMGQHTSQQIKDAYSSWDPRSGGGTPIYPALQTIRSDQLYNTDDDDYDPHEDARVKAIMLVSDGVPSTSGTACGSTSGITDIIRDLHDNHNVFTFVVGFAHDSVNLANWAEAGGTGTHFLADDADSLADAVRDIAAALVTCNYQLETPAQDPNKVWVSVNGDYLSRSDYSYNAGSNILALSESACDEVRSFDAETLNLYIEQGCADQCVAEDPSDLLCDLYYETCGAPYPCDSCSPEVCDGSDNNCNGIIDEGCPDCSIEGAECEANSDCCGAFICGDDNTCQHSCYPGGVTCSQNSQCCSGICSSSGGDSFGECVVN